MQIKFLRGTSTHLAYLIEWVQRTQGPVLELGIGYGSTPTLHALCRYRTLVSYENSPYYFEGFRNYRTENHSILLAEDWDTIPIEQHWGLAFVDCAPTLKRKDLVLRLKDWADFIMVHDTERKSDFAYQFKDAFKGFKYRRDYKALMPHTCVLSEKYPI